MKTIAITASILLLAMIAAACPIDAQQDVTIDDKDINVLLFEEMEYPSVVLQTRIQGVVVVRAALDEKGSVISAAAISGAKALVPSCLSNVRKWHFQPNAAKTVVVVYEFHFASGTCIAGVKGQFIFLPPNVATVRSCQRIATP